MTIQERLIMLWQSARRHQVYILGVLGWVIIYLSQPVGSQLPVYAGY
jgi:hypothetical protein